MQQKYIKYLICHLRWFWLFPAFKRRIFLSISSKFICGFDVLSFQKSYFRLSINKFSVCQVTIGIVWITALSNQRRICKNVVLKVCGKCIYLPMINLCYIFSWNIVFSTRCKGMDSPPASFTVWKQEKGYFQMYFQSLSSFWKLEKTFSLACSLLCVLLKLCIQKGTQFGFI